MVKASKSLNLATKTLPNKSLQTTHIEGIFTFYVGIVARRAGPEIGSAF